MVTAVLVSLLLTSGAHPLRIVVLGAAILTPEWFLMAAGGWVAWHGWKRTLAHRQLPAQEAAFLSGVAAELEAGASLNLALAEAADRAPGLDLRRVVRWAGVGRSPVELGELLRDALPVNGPVAAGAFGLAATTGTAGAEVFTALAVRAVDAAALARERRALTAQGRLSAWLVGGLPVAAVVGMTILGRGPALDEPGALVSGVGLSLIGAGGLAVWLMARSA